MNTGRKATNGNPRRREPKRPTGPLICALDAHRLVLRKGKLFCRECDWIPPS